MKFTKWRAYSYIDTELTKTNYIIYYDKFIMTSPSGPFYMFYYDFKPLVSNGPYKVEMNEPQLSYDFFKPGSFISTLALCVRKF